MGVRELTKWEIWRPVPVDDGSGGQTVTAVQVGSERGDVRELSGRELIEARAAGAEHSHAGFFRARANIERNDELRRGDERLLVITVTPTFPARDRVRVNARSIEAGG